MFIRSALFLSAFAAALPSVASQKTGFEGNFSGGSEGGLEGTVVVQDANKLVVDNYVLADAGAPSLYWWGSTTDDISSGFRISEKQVTETADGSTLQITLDAGKTAADFSTVGLWCERFGVNFGQATLAPGIRGGNAPSSSGGNSDTPTSSKGIVNTPAPTGGSDTSNPSEKKSSKSSGLHPIISDKYTTARAYLFSVLGLLFLESMMHLPLYLLILFNGDQPYVRSPSRHSKIYLFIHKVFTRPSPIPFLTTLAIPDLLRLAIFVGLNILWGWNRNKYSSDFQIYGWLTLANGALALLLGARSNLFTLVARIPSTTLLLYHRWLGRATVIHATIHMARLLRSYITSGQISTVLKTLRIQVGLMAWISLALILLTSFNFIRRRKFEVFYYVHGLFILFVVGGLIHAAHGPEFLIPGLVLYIIDRLIRFGNNFRSIETVSVTQYDGGLTKFKVRGVRKHKPGQIAWVQIPGASFLNWHPFTITSSPSNPEHATFAIRGLGGYTKKVQAIAAADGESQELKQNSPASPTSHALTLPKIRVDGPYGVGHMQWGTNPLTIIVAGGVGITPGISIITHIMSLATKLRGQTSGPRWNAHILWVIKAPQHTAWFEEELSQLAAIAADPAVPATLDIRIHVTGDKATEESATELRQPSDHQDRQRLPIQHGRPNMRAYFQGLRDKYPGLDAVISACGPRPLIDSVRRDAVAEQGHGTNKGAYHVDEEVFEL